MTIIDTLFGHGKDLNTLHMCMRAFIMFFITLLIIRISGRRSFGSKSPVDNIIAIMLGAILSRAVTGASAFLPTIAAGLILGFTHRIVALACRYYPALSNFIKGQVWTLYKDGQVNKENLKRNEISEADLLEGVRMGAGVRELDEVDEIKIERSGELSIIKKKA